MKHLNDWFVWRLVWDATEGKYEKKPADLSGGQLGKDSGGAGNPANRHSHAAALAALAALHASYPPGGPLTYALGFWMTSEAGYWFLDIDKCVRDGTVMPLAQQLWGMFPGAAWEYSSSGRGLHVIGRGQAPANHRTKPTKEINLILQGMELEFYTSGRGIAFGFQELQGDCNTVHDAGVAALCQAYFPERIGGAGGDVRRPEWKGPAEDDALIERMLRSRPSAEAAFAGKSSLRDLWFGDAPEGNESDMALASHLAFWTGCDGDRMERLMRRSGLYRAKWDSHKTYLRELTIKNACASCERVYAERELPVLLATGTEAPAVSMGVEEFIKAVNATDSFELLVSDRMVEAQSLQIHPLELDRVCNAIINRMKVFGGNYALPKMRALLSPKNTSAAISDVPDWMKTVCFVSKGDFIYDSSRGVSMSILGFNTKYLERMPLKQNGRRESPFEWASEKWNIRVVDDAMYMPTMGVYYTYAARDYVNLFNPNTLPLPQEIDVHTATMIQRFMEHLYMLCGRRDMVYQQLIMWMAYNAQFPGRKIKWMPLIVGVPGDGKSILGDVITAAMGGSANCRITAVNTLKNSGGFTDWAHGRCVNFIEEIHMVGEKRYEFYEAMKNYIELGVININPKGKVTFDVPNTCNHIANSNHRNAMPLDRKDRRVMVVFTPYSDADEAARDRGLADRNALPDYFAGIGNSCRSAPGQWRSWLLSIDTSLFVPHGRAPETPERESMIAANKSDGDGLIEDALETGGLGISRQIFSSSMLRSAVTVAARMSDGQVPQTTGWYLTLNNLGYTKFPRRVKWKGKVHDVWHQGSMKVRDEAHARELLEETGN